MKQINSILVLVHTILTPYGYWLILISLLYISGLLVFHFYQEEKEKIPRTRYLMRIVNFGIAGWLLLYSILLLVTNSDMLDNLFWIVPICTCPLPFILMLILSVERFLLRDARYIK
jgi:hypothetical protein